MPEPKMCTRCQMLRSGYAFVDHFHPNICAYCLSRQKRSEKVGQLTIFDVIEPPKMEEPIRRTRVVRRQDPIEYMDHEEFTDIDNWLIEQARKHVAESS